MSNYELGQRVRITGTAVKTHEGLRTEYRESRGPFRPAYPNDKVFTEGVIVGSRTVQPGVTDSGDWQEMAVFLPDIGKSMRVWVVAFDLRMKPCWCFGHQIEPMEDTR